jgi:hypothetical protein
VLADGVEETPEEEDWSLEEPLDVEPVEVDDEPVDVPVASGSVVVAPLEVDVSDAVVAEPLPAGVAALCSAGSSPACSRSARTPKTATMLASAPAAKRRPLGARRRRRRGAGGTAAGSLGSSASGMHGASGGGLKRS